MATAARGTAGPAGGARARRPRGTRDDGPAHGGRTLRCGCEGNAAARGAPGFAYTVGRVAATRAATAIAGSHGPSDLRIRDVAGSGCGSSSGR